MTVAVLWRMPLVAFLLGASFAGMLRTSELRHMRVSDLFTPAKLLSADRVLYIALPRPKMRRLTARRAYVRVDDPTLVLWAELICERFAADSYLFPHGYPALRRIFLAIAEDAGLGAGPSCGLTWWSVRPGGATWLLHVTNSPEFVRFRGRWMSARMLEIYVQELNSVAFGASLSAAARARVDALADAAPVVFGQLLNDFDSYVPSDSATLAPRQRSSPPAGRMPAGTAAAAP